MTNDTHQRACIATSQTGRSCLGHVLNDAVIALCHEHELLVYLGVQGRLRGHLKSIGKAQEYAEKGIDSRMNPETAEAYAEQSQVYYIRIGDYIKIGYTQNLKERLNGLRVDASDILATEPGGRDKERQRHLQFADIRIGRRENFERTADLLTHIAKVRRENGKPKITGYLKTTAA